MAEIIGTQIMIRMYLKNIKGHLKELPMANPRQIKSKHK